MQTLFNIMLPVISVQNLGKKYVLDHQPKERYLSLRDVFADNVKHFAQKLQAPFTAENKVLLKEDFWALKNVSFDIQQGDKVGIIGRNGAGKSTLLKILSRITEPTTGRLKIKGRVASLLEVGTGFHPELTGRENIFLNGAILGMRKAEIKRKFDEIVSFAEVEQFLDTPVKRYSSGMYTRLAFSVAAHLEPEILIVDEVLAVGDARFQKKCMGKMQEVGSEGRTVLFVSHNIDAIASLCNKGILLHKGEVACIDSATAVTQAYMVAMYEGEYSVKNCERVRKGGIEIVDVWIADDENKLIENPEVDKKVNFCVKFRIEDYLKSKKIDIGFGVDTLDGRRLFSTLASWKKEEVITTKNEITVKCKFKSMPLNPSKYLISAVVFAENGDAMDFVTHCVAFSILNEPKDYYFKVEKAHGDFIVPFDFEST